MTVEEAIFYLKTDREQKIDAMSSPEVAKKTCTVIAYDMGIEALEKQIPKKVKEFLPLTIARCPACNEIMGAHAGRKYCYYCGQALDWSDAE